MRTDTLSEQGDQPSWIMRQSMGLITYVVPWWFREEHRTILVWMINYLYSRAIHNIHVVSYLVSCNISQVPSGTLIVKVRWLRKNSNSEEVHFVK